MKARLLLLSCVFSMVVLPSVRVLAQQFHEDVAVERVNVYLTAIDKKGQFVTDLKPDELVIKENGVVQAVTNFANLSLQSNDPLGEKDVPITVAFLIDSSESMSAGIQRYTKIDIVKNASFRLLDELREQDQMMLISFNEMPTE